MKKIRPGGDEWHLRLEIRAFLDGGGGPQVGEVTCGG